jgi:hypothetical protein
MSEFKGTKGKWKLINGWDKEGKGCFPSVIFFGDEQQYKKSMGRNGVTINSSHDQKPESLMANALLISKSPEMLEMLERFSESENTPMVLRKQAKQLIKEATQN